MTTTTSTDTSAATNTPITTSASATTTTTITCLLSVHAFEDYAKMSNAFYNLEKKREQPESFGKLLQVFLH
ncbi:hypothetical protein BGX38DRAFT_1281812 [Terfezia claveryi]|nr:hypothetical protein BGX38DRAFT_1281812 [Terfezia claveryi]